MNSKIKLNEVLEKRWSPRAFSDKEIETEKLERIFEAARRAPSCANEQPWKFIIGIKGHGETWDKIFSVLVEFNQLWAKQAPVLGLVIGQTHFEKSGDVNKHHFYDCGQSMAFLTFQATVEGLYLHQMAGFDAEKSEEVFDLPKGYESISTFALGYIGDPASLPERMQKNEYYKVIRKELSEIVFTFWNKPFDFTRS